MLEVLKAGITVQRDRHRAIARRSPNCFFAVISQPLIYDGDMKCSYLMTHVGHCVCKSGGWLSGKVQAVPASPQCHDSVVSLCKEHTGSPPRMGSARQLHQGHCRPPGAKLRLGILLCSPHPPTHHSRGNFGSPTAQVCSPRLRTQLQAAATAHPHSQSSRAGAGRHRASPPSMGSKPRTHSDWTSLAHVLTSEPIAVVVA